jgi:hypothetical protein
VPQQFSLPIDQTVDDAAIIKRNFEVFSDSDWLAALTAHIPNAGITWCATMAGAVT